ncbi:MAG: hypothetical protein D6689_07785 [Deltaproteobacteria bacterium]|nr:MAG: hypothetical protein D6689_07785 [Deltaproteobacteria bacterium]
MPRVDRARALCYEAAMSARRPASASAATVAVALAATAAFAGTPAAAGKRAVAVRAAVAPRIDGRLDDAVWRAAPFVHDFAQREPHEGAAPLRRTEVAFAYDDDYLYVGARMYARGPDDVQAVVTRRDDSGSAERIIVSFDPFLDRRTAYSFAVTAAGVRVDWLHTDDNMFARDYSYNPVWDAAVHVGPHGWTAEMKIPFSQLRFPRRQHHAWGVNINRYRPQDNEDVFWVVVPKGVVAWSSWFGELAGIAGIRGERGAELLPYAAAEARIGESADGGGVDGRAGIDAKIGLGSSFTLDATVNPDFGQVEADPAVVNLSAFEARFSEQRPFFVEGRQLLAGLGPAYFYSRRIGGAPRALNDLSASPQPTRILGAAKLTGRTRGGTSAGALAAITSTLPDRTFDPLQAFGVGRLQREFGPNASIVGASIAAVERTFGDDDAVDDGTPLADLLPRAAVSGGVDWRLRFSGGEYEVGGFAGGSSVHGSAAAIEAVQRSSAHYFQRPDQSHVRLDPARRSLAGWTAALAARKRSGHVRAFATVGAESPGLELNDVGLLHSADDAFVEAGASFEEEHPTRWTRTWRVGASIAQEWNFGGVRKPLGLEVNAAVELPNYVAIDVFGSYRTAGIDDDATRGGPLMEVGPARELGAGIRNRHGARTSWSASAVALSSDTGDAGWIVQARLSAIPADRLQIQLEPAWTRVRVGRQYLATVDGGRDETFGQRYVFATVARRELAVTARVKLALTPDLAVELFAQPFASAGDYTAFGELAAPRSRELIEYEVVADTDDELALSGAGGSVVLPQPDFTVLSLRSTLVVRWEFAPGSTLFAVWQQDRADGAPRATAAGLSGLGDAVSAPGEHAILVKLAYWWPIR